MVTLAMTVAIASQLVGILMVASLLILPSATARILSRTPESMAKAAVGISMAGTVLGLHFSWEANVPTTPMITLSFMALFCVFYVIKKVIIKK
jgi:zinc transport system permease protein